MDNLTNMPELQYQFLQSIIRARDPNFELQQEKERETMALRRFCLRTREASQFIPLVACFAAKQSAAADARARRCARARARDERPARALWHQDHAQDARTVHQAHV